MKRPGYKPQRPAKRAFASNGRAWSLEETRRLQGRVAGTVTGHRLSDGTVLVAYSPRETRGSQREIAEVVYRLLGPTSNRSDGYVQINIIIPRGP